MIFVNADMKDHYVANIEMSFVGVYQNISTDQFMYIENLFTFANLLSNNTNTK